MLPPLIITLTSTLFLLLSLVRAHPPVARLDELIDGLSDTCICDEACTTIVETECTDIQCACNLQLQAQQCIVSCERTSAAVDAFNAYLDSCVKESLAIPTATLPVVGISSSAVAYVQTTVQPTAAAAQQGTAAPAQALAGSAMGYDNVGDGEGAGAAAAAVQPAAGTAASWLEVDSSNAGAVSTPSAVAAAAAATAAQTGGRAGGSLSLTNYDPVNPAAATGGVAGTSGNTGTTMTTNTSTTAAFDATQSFFSQAVSEDCQTPCQCWKDAADACTDDACLCTPDAFQFARECNECVGSSKAAMNARNLGDLPGMPWSGSDDEAESQGTSRGASGAQSGSSGPSSPSMGSYYSKFTEACQAKVPGISNGAAGLQQGRSGVEVVPTGGLGYATGGANAGARVASGGQPIMLTDANGRTQYAGGGTVGAGVGAGGAEYSTNTVTATAAMYAQETVVVDADSGDDGSDSSWFSDGASSRQVITWELLLVCIGVSLVLL